MERIIAAVRIRPVEEKDPEQIGITRSGVNGIIAKKHSDKFTFENVYSQEATNSQIFEKNIQPLLERATKGYNGKKYWVTISNSMHIYVWANILGQDFHYEGFQIAAWDHSS